MINEALYVRKRKPYQNKYVFKEKINPELKKPIEVNLPLSGHLFLPRDTDTL